MLKPLVDFATMLIGAQINWQVLTETKRSWVKLRLAIHEGKDRKP
jgi:hypothetical protein